MKIIVHAGMPKTGTTFLQKQLSTLFSSTGSPTFYPQLEENQESHNMLIKDLLPQNGNVRLYARHGEDTFLTGAYFLSLSEAVKAHRECETLIVSGELMHKCIPLLVEKLKETFPNSAIDVVVYFRFPVSDFLASSYQQIVKASMALPNFKKMKSLLQQAEDTYDDCVTLALDEKANFIPRIYNKDAFCGGTILDDFAFATGLDLGSANTGSANIQSPPRVNSSLTAEGTYLFRNFREHCLGESRNNDFEWRSRRLLRALLEAENQVRDGYAENNVPLTKLEFRPDVKLRVESLSLDFLGRLSNSEHFDSASREWLKSLIQFHQQNLPQSAESPKLDGFHYFFDLNPESLEYLSSVLMERLIRASLD